MTDELQALLACPFCGGKAQTALMHGGGLEWAQVECVNRNCGAVGPTPATEAEAIAAWNRRNERPALIAEAERLRGALADANETIVAFAGPWAARYAQEHNYAPGHLHPKHYDILAKAGARMDDFNRVTFAGQP